MIEERPLKNGNKSYRVKIRIPGSPSLSRSFKKITDAKRWEAKKETEIREGKNFDTPQNKRMTVQELIERYLTDHLPLENIKDKSKVERGQRLNWWLKEIGNKLLADIKLPLLNQLKAKLIQTRNKSGKLYSADTVNYYLGDFSLVLRVASNEWELIRDNPMLKVKKMKKPRGRLRYLDEVELKALLKACRESSNQHLYLIVLLCLSTGARKGEILNLTSDLVDLDKQRIYLQDTKNGERRMLSIKEPVLSLLRSHIQSMFPNQKIIFMGSKFNQPIDIRSAWVNAIKRSGIQDFKFHDLRHTAASYLAMNGATPIDIATILGHKTLAMVKRYAHLSESHIDELVEDMNSKHFLGLD